jgi:hypothetical protein
VPGPDDSFNRRRGSLDEGEVRLSVPAQGARDTDEDCVGFGQAVRVGGELDAIGKSLLQLVVGHVVDV